MWGGRNPLFGVLAPNGVASLYHVCALVRIYADTNGLGKEESPMMNTDAMKAGLFARAGGISGKTGPVL